MNTIVKCSKCGIPLYELIPGNNSKKIFRSFATENNGDCTCINCHEKKGIEEIKETNKED